MGNNYLLFQQWGSTLLGTYEMLEQIEDSKPDTVIIFCGQEPQFIYVDTEDKLHPDFVEEFDRIILKYNIEVHIIFGSAHPPVYSGMNYLLPSYNTTVHYFPMYWLYKTLEISEENESPELNSLPKVQADKLFISLVRRASSHRCTAMDILSEVGLLENDFYYSWHDHEPRMCEFRHWKKKITHLSDNYSNNNPNQYLKQPKEMWHSAFNFVMETNAYSTFWTEKTFQAMYFEKPFVILGGAGMNYKLKHFGFKLYEDLFNYEYLRNCYDVPLRAEKIIRNLVDIKNKFGKDPQKLYEHCLPVVRHNKARLLEIVDKQLFIPSSILNLFRDYKLDSKTLRKIGWPTTINDIYSNKI